MVAGITKTAEMMHGMGKAGRTKHAFDNAEAGSEDGPEQQEAAPRHQESELLHSVEEAAELTGEQLFGYAMFAGIGGWLTRNTVGRIFPSVRPAVGRLTFAPVQALDSLSFSDLLKNPKSLVANYYGKMAEYCTQHAKAPDKAQHFINMAEKWGGAKFADVKWEGLKNLPKYLAHGPVFSRVMAAGLAAGGGIALYRSGRHIHDGMADLQEIAEDLTGQKISVMDLTQHPEKLPPMVREMRNNLIDHLKVDSAATAGVMIEKGAFAVLGGPAQHMAGGIFGLPMAGMMGGMMLHQAADGFKPQQHFVDAYLHIKDTLKEGKKVTVDSYAQLMASASAEVRRCGGASGEQVKRIAEEYAEEQISAADVVKEIYNHDAFKARAGRIAEQMHEEMVDNDNEKDNAVPEAVKTTAANANAQPLPEVAKRAFEQAAKPTTAAVQQSQLMGRVAQAPTMVRGALQ